MTAIDYCDSRPGQQTIISADSLPHDSSCKRCELPADIPNGHYIIVHGTDFVYGATIKYICKEGYQMVSRVNTRTCLAGGWDDRLPICQGNGGCGPPPHIEFAETTTFQKTYYRPDETVQYICHNYYKQDGNPYMTCTQGKWKRGYLRCLSM
ncbi:complement factor H like 4 [Electrophorus electricus]|uniref:complement factor H like 4 n=1 Tax=Electrophorus electricus TaxID=8005 RepID=UPI0015CFB9F5|nr:complement factor H like 4 [Electrophorus electricus]